MRITWQKYDVVALTAAVVVYILSPDAAVVENLWKRFAISRAAVFFWQDRFMPI